jgi:N-acyl-D-amino-acid deacylase
VTKEENKKYQGRSVHDICESLGCEDEVTFVSNLLVDEQAKVGIIVMSMAQEDVDAVAKLPYSMVISDALYGAPDCPHPRLYGSFSKIIREYVIERSVLSMECAINKMTGMTAERFHIPGRGRILKGNYADLNIFVPENVADHAIYGDSKKLSTGMEAVLIGGEVVWKNNLRTGRCAAQVLKSKIINEKGEIK